jgi:hypothetical protein
MKLGCLKTSIVLPLTEHRKSVQIGIYYTALITACMNACTQSVLFSDVVGLAQPGLYCLLREPKAVLISYKNSMRLICNVLKHMFRAFVSYKILPALSSHHIYLNTSTVRLSLWILTGYS